MFYIIYQTTNKLNGKVYVGAHRTTDLNDGYIGSGKRLLRAVEKYGLENFTTEILFQCETETEMWSKEAEIVNESWVASANTYNLKIGGFGGWDHVDNTGRIFNDITRQKMSNAAKMRVGDKNPFYGKKHTQDTLNRIGAKSKERGKRIYDQRISKGNHPNNKGTCPHCGKTGQMRAMKRWHFSNCQTAHQVPDVLPLNH